MSVWFSGQNLGWGRAIILHLDLEWQINRLEVILKSWDEVGLELMKSNKKYSHSYFLIITGWVEISVVSAMFS
jgi:hypothetical protein